MARGKRFFKDDVTILMQQSVPNGSGGTKVEWVAIDTFKGFLDTPDTDKKLYAMQMNKSFDRELYYPSNITIPLKVRLRCDGITYEQQGEPQDQGGQGEIYCLPLKKVT